MFFEIGTPGFLGGGGVFEEVREGRKMVRVRNYFA